MGAWVVGCVRVVMDTSLQWEIPVGCLATTTMQSLFQIHPLAMSFTYLTVKLNVQTLSKLAEENSKAMLEEGVVTRKLRKLLILVPG